ncbi:hypothetical protein D9M68_708180 [compost metagenome]
MGRDRLSQFNARDEYAGLTGAQGGGRRVEIVEPDLGIARQGPARQQPQFAEATQQAIAAAFDQAAARLPAAADFRA